MPGDHLLDIGVELAQAALLAGVERAAVPRAELDVPEHRRVAHQDQQREPPVEHEQQHQRAHDLHKGLDQHGKAVVERVGDGVHVVGEQAHQVAFAVGVKKLQRQRLQVGKQVAADLAQDLLRGAHHQLAVAQRAQRARNVDARREGNAAGQVGRAAVLQQAVDDGADHVGAQQRRQRTDRGHDPHQRQQGAVAAQVAAQAAHGIAEVLRAAAAGDVFHSASPPFRCEA